MHEAIGTPNLVAPTNYQLRVGKENFSAPNRSRTCQITQPSLGLKLFEKSQ